MNKTDKILKQILKEAFEDLSVTRDIIDARDESIIPSPVANVMHHGCGVRSSTVQNSQWDRDPVGGLLRWVQARETATEDADGNLVETSVPTFILNQPTLGGGGPIDKVDIQPVYLEGGNLAVFDESSGSWLQAPIINLLEYTKKDSNQRDYATQFSTELGSLQEDLSNIENSREQISEIEERLGTDEEGDGDRFARYQLGQKIEELESAVAERVPKLQQLAPYVGAFETNNNILPFISAYEGTTEDSLAIQNDFFDWRTSDYDLGDRLLSPEDTINVNKMPEILKGERGVYFDEEKDEYLVFDFGSEFDEILEKVEGMDEDDLANWFTGVLERTSAMRRDYQKRYEYTRYLNRDILGNATLGPENNGLDIDSLEDEANARLAEYNLRLEDYDRGALLNQIDIPTVKELFNNTEEAIDFIESGEEPDFSIYKHRALSALTNDPEVARVTLNEAGALEQANKISERLDQQGFAYGEDPNALKGAIQEIPLNEYIQISDEESGDIILDEPALTHTISNLVMEGEEGVYFQKDLLESFEDERDMSIPQDAREDLLSEDIRDIVDLSEITAYDDIDDIRQQPLDTFLVDSGKDRIQELIGEENIFDEDIRSYLDEPGDVTVGEVEESLAGITEEDIRESIRDRVGFDAPHYAAGGAVGSTLGAVGARLLDRNPWLGGAIGGGVGLAGTYGLEALARRGLEGQLSSKE